jgi:hypothetical protein
VHLDPPEATRSPQPIDDQRHAPGIRDQNPPSNKPITTLCGRQLTRTLVTGAEWRWLGCREYWSAAKAHVKLHASTMPSTESNQT